MDKEKIVRVPVVDLNVVEGKIQMLEAIVTTMSPISVDNGISYDEAIFLDDIHSHLTFLQILYKRLTEKKQS